jgi:DnaJ family protein C protein 27
MTERLDPIRVRIISLGDVGTGKSCLIKRYCESRFAAKSIPTIGVDYGTRTTSRKTNDGRQLEVKMDFFDLSGERSSSRWKKFMLIIL